MTISTVLLKPKSLHKANTKQRSRRSTFLKWLRDIHGWVGLWGAVLGLLFGVTGIIHNHRTVLKIELEKPVVNEVQLVVPDTAKKDPQALAAWLGEKLSMDRAPRIKKEESTTVSWNGQDVIQPEHWDIRFAAPEYRVVGDYWVGSNSVNVKRTDETWVGTIDNLHRATGAGVGWVLLADSIGGSLVLLSITGVLLWTELNRRKTVGTLIFVFSLAALLAITVNTL